MLAVCSIRADFSVATWNQTMAEISQLPAIDVIGTSLVNLPQPWSRLLLDFVESENTQSLSVKFDNQLLLNLHKSTGEDTGTSRNSQDELFIIIEKTDETQLAESRLLHKERLASIGQVAAGVAHEIGNPVTGIACLAQNLKLDSVDSNTHKIADQILEQTDRISTILQSLAFFVHGDSQGKKHKTKVELRDCVNDTITLLSLGHKYNQFYNHCEPELYIAGDSQRLSQVFVNTLTNARDASPEGASIEIRACTEQGGIRIEIEDQGYGIAADTINNIFEPFFTTKDPGEGTGLGLAIARSIINEHMGTIVAKSPVMQNLEISEDSASQSEPRLPGTVIIISIPEYPSSKNDGE